MGSAKYTQLQAVVELARRALREEMVAGDALSSPRAVRDYLRLTLGSLPHEVFMVLLLDAQNRLIVAEELFRGTLTQTSVHPREVVKLARRTTPPAPSLPTTTPRARPNRAGPTKRSPRSRQALTLVDVKLLDHFIVAGAADPLSFAERGLLDR